MVDDFIAFHSISRSRAVRYGETDTFSIKRECILEHDTTLDLLYGGNKFSRERDWRSEIGAADVTIDLDVIFIKTLFRNGIEVPSE